MAITNATGTPTGQITAPRKIAGPGETAADLPAPPPDTVAIQATATDGPPRARVLEANVQFATGAATPGTGGQPQLDQALDAMVATFKTLSPEQQRALLADPGFVIEIEGKASNLGSDRNYDNVGLSRKRARNTGEYVKAYLKQRGIEIPADRVKTTGSGNPGKSKAADDDDPADRIARVKITMPGLSPLPPAAPAPAPDPAPAPEPVPSPAPEPSPAEAALAQFNESTAPLNAQLAKGHDNQTTLADREKVVAETRKSLESAAGLLGQLPPTAQPGAHALVNGLRDQVDRLAERAARERDALGKAQAQLKAEAESLAKAEGTKKKKGLRETAAKLLETYREPEKMAAELPPDARADLTKQASDLKRTVYETLARHSDDYNVDERDNSYMFGRPGPKFKKAWESLKGLLQGGTPSAEDRTKAINALKDMGDAVNDFDDPLMKEATRVIYDDLTRAVTAKLSG
ncbi:MAG: OmpA family protein [Candidatus Sericytochromatia bacterium]|nr:OmpA family protein [Candidatus Tanganyikabacteria bacterium]